MVFYWKSIKGIHCIGCLIISKLKEMEKGFKILSGRDDKNTDSTENVKRGQKLFRKTQEEGVNFVQIDRMREVNIFSSFI